jgi:hypothetical protein
MRHLTEHELIVHHDDPDGLVSFHGDGPMPGERREAEVS